MPGGNFDSPLKISKIENGGSGFVEWPTGPLVRDDGETILRVEVWVMQQSTGGIQITYSTSFPNGSSSWKADKIWYPKSVGSESWQYNGIFKPGAALGTAVLISTKSNVQSVYWWTQEVDLEYA
jgi:hypothetical protein